MQLIVCFRIWRLELLCFLFNVGGLGAVGGVGVDGRWVDLCGIWTRRRCKRIVRTGRPGEVGHDQLELSSSQSQGKAKHLLSMLLNIPKGVGDEGESEWGEKGEVSPLTVGDGIMGLFNAIIVAGRSGVVRGQTFAC